MTVLYLDKNQFQFTPAHSSICLLKKLQKLNLSSNNRSTAKFENCFSKLKDLYSLDISNNSIKQLKPDDFYAFRNIRVTDLLLTQLKLSTISKEYFHYLPYLRYLGLQQNELTSLPSDTFKALDLKSLLLIGNKLKIIPGYALSNMIHIEELALRQNDIMNCTFSADFMATPILKHIDISGNPFGTLTNLSFINLGNLNGSVQLILSKCKIQEIEANTFLPIKSLHTFDAG